MSKEYEGLTREELIAMLRRRDSQARYGLVWEQKDIAQDKALNRDFVGLELDTKLSCGDAPWTNLIVEGDNYDALRNLVSTYAGKVQLIYIDPPYNTGRKDFVYNDHYFDSTDLFRHSTWLEFMYQRLRLAKDLLTPDGAIFVSIDDNELFNLGLLMNKVFGERNFVANCIWQKRYSRENREAIGDVHEYVMVYAPNPDLFKARRGKLPLTSEQAKVYKNPGNPNETDPTKRWQSISLTAQGYRPNQMYKITAPNGKEHYPPEGRCWATVEGEYLKLFKANRITFGKDGNGVPRQVRYLSDVEGVVPWTWWPHEEVGHTDEAKKEIQSLFGVQTAFDTPKPVRLMERVLQIGAPEKDAIVLDFFAGSGTTAHAVLKMNKADEGNRRFILVSSREATEKEPEKNICRDVCAQRVRWVIEGHTLRKGEKQDAWGGNFAYLRARHVPVHRLEDHLTDSMIWSFIQMSRDHVLTPVSTPLSLSVKGDSAVAYMATTKKAELEALQDALSRYPGLEVYTWSPEALSPLMSVNNIRSVPEDLVRSFRFGHFSAGVQS